VFISEREAERLARDEREARQQGIRDPLRGVDEQEILSRVRSGDTLAYGELLRRFRKKVDYITRVHYSSAQYLIVNDERRAAEELANRFPSARYRPKEAQPSLASQGVSQEDFRAELNFKLINLAKRYKPGPATFRGIRREMAGSAGDNNEEAPS
jgi:hypothetical protein